MTLGTIVRFVTAEDFSQWLPLWEGYNQFYGRFGSTALSADITETTWRRFLDVDEPMYALVAEDTTAVLMAVSQSQPYSSRPDRRCIAYELSWNITARVLIEHVVEQS